MRRFTKSALFVLLLVLTGNCLAAPKQEVLESGNKDRITIQYDVSEHGGQVTISISAIKKNLSMTTRDEYDDFNKLKVVFFDKVGGYSNIEFTPERGISISCFRINRDELRFSKKSNDGYYLLHDKESTDLNFEVLTDQPITLSIPIYLAYYKKSRRYQVFAFCGNLNIPIAKKQAPAGKKQPTQVTQTTQRSETITQTEEIEGEADLPKTEIAKNVINLAGETLTNPNATIMELETAVQQLITLKTEIDDAKLKDAINEKIALCQNKISEMRSQEKEDVGRTALMEQEKAQQEKAQRDLQYVEERLSKIDQLSDGDLGDLKATANELRKQSYAIKDPELAKKMTRAADDCDAKMQEIEAAKKRRNIWLTIGGILLMACLFVSNKAYQNFQNNKRDKKLSDMQQSMAKKAQDEAKRRARSLAQSKISQARSEVRKTTNNMVKNATNDLTKGKIKKTKKISI